MTPARFAIFLVLLAVFAYFAAKEFPSLRVPTFDARGFYRPGEAPTILNDLGDDRAPYLVREQTVDMVFPVVYASLFAMAIVIFGPASRAPWWLVLIPIAGAAFDYIENVSVIRMLQLYPGALGVWPTIAAIATPIKTMLFVMSALLMVGLGAMWPFRR